ncbi:uncharacterized protein BO97DRAFT_422617 [Aspergillus homomorphus CBS 101889]|uniref:Uncharacterized protein n=1 Tax=Aspergillus homomorphus (strain CBS 101889) TaxID=1450537 RepID=A0A395I4M8_ASPHC|nr:hypothetical protein BO97DRAFT_422617 [Aspergillus homomorphus CBS 101889]RAL14725.1 hypothetical protein BO97DRAFT_422617 [Aspergillus homomorphus CBS 101889]
MKSRVIVVLVDPKICGEDWEDIAHSTAYMAWGMKHTLAEDHNQQLYGAFLIRKNMVKLCVETPVSPEAQAAGRGVLDALAGANGQRWFAMGDSDLYFHQQDWLRRLMPSATDEERDAQLVYLDQQLRDLEGRSLARTPSYISPDESANAYAYEFRARRTRARIAARNSWYMDADVPGKRVGPLIFLEGFLLYREECYR